MSINEKIYPLTPTQKTIGKRMELSKRNLPCFYLGSQADITELNTLRRQASKKLKAKISTNDIFFAAMSRAVCKYPLMAARIEGDDLKIADCVNVGFAVSGQDDKLLVPVIKNTDKMTIAEISKVSAALTQKAKIGSLLPNEMSGACIGLSSLGMFGLKSFIAILPPDMTSIISIGKPDEMLESIQGSLSVRKRISVTIAVNAKVVDQVYAARFLSELISIIEMPQILF